MAGAKIIKKRIASVKNTRKITRTMEMVSTAKSKKLVTRVAGAQPYARKLREMMASLGDLGSRIDSPFLRVEEHPRNVAFVVITANRGLCGGYNSNVLKLLRAQYLIQQSEGRQPTVYAIGKKAISYLRFVKIGVARSWTHFDDNFSYEMAEELAEFLMEEFAAGRLDRVEIISTIYHSAGSQRPGITQLLPLSYAEAAADGAAPKESPGPVIYEPAPELIAAQMIPLSIKTSLFRALLEAVASEQIARRVAMKNATDAAGEMLRLMTRYYNRVRQAGITQELAEIVGGADAL
ncbi:MAG: ATP synthase F1 subunit gamma [Leptospirales bacterium]|nr:ATP synthase F1 subunit gamma [Leptospirales bacterium]